jgi:hypothetical protein
MITIDTTKKKASKMRLSKSKINPLQGWRPFANSSARKRSIFERLGLWRKLGHRRRKTETQAAMFS